MPSRAPRKSMVAPRWASSSLCPASEVSPAHGDQVAVVGGNSGLPGLEGGCSRPCASRDRCRESSSSEHEKASRAAVRFRWRANWPVDVSHAVVMVAMALRAWRERALKQPFPALFVAPSRPEEWPPLQIPTLFTTATTGPRAPHHRLRGVDAWALAPADWRIRRPTPSSRQMQRRCARPSMRSPPRRRLLPRRTPVWQQQRRGGSRPPVWPLLTPTRWLCRARTARSRNEKGLLRGQLRQPCWPRPSARTHRLSRWWA